MKPVFCTINVILFLTISTVSNCCSIPEQLELLKSPLNKFNKKIIRERLETIQAFLELPYQSDKEIDLGNLENYTKHLQKIVAPLSGSLEGRCSTLAYQIHEKINEIRNGPLQSGLK